MALGWIGQCGCYTPESIYDRYRGYDKPLIIRAEGGHPPAKWRKFVVDPIMYHLTGTDCMR